MDGIHSFHFHQTIRDHAHCLIVLKLETVQCFFQSMVIHADSTSVLKDQTVGHQFKWTASVELSLMQNSEVASSHGKTLIFPLFNIFIWYQYFSNAGIGCHGVTSCLTRCLILFHVKTQRCLHRIQQNLQLLKLRLLKLQPREFYKIHSYIWW